MADRSEITAAAGRLRRQLETVKEHQRSVWLGEGIGLLVAAVVAALGLAMALDNLAHLHILIRLPILAGLVALAVVLGRRMARLLRQPLTPEMIAVKVERQFPDLDNRLINSLLLAHEDDEEVLDLVRAVVTEGSEDATHRDLRSAVPKRKMRLCALGSTLSIVLMAAYAVLFPNHFTNAFARIVAPFAGTPPLTRTRILAVAPRDHDLLSGDDVTIAADVEGKIPDTCEVLYEPEGEDKQMAIMRPAAGDEEGEKRAFRCLMADVARSFTYRVAAGDATSKTYRVTVHHRPVVEKLALRITPPSYTARSPITQHSGTVKALAGSTVAVEATCSKDIAEASLALSNAKEPAATSVSGKVVTGSFKVIEDCTYQIALTDTHGFDNEPAQHDVELIVDEPPEVKLTAPPPTSVVKQGASLPFRFTVTDRYGVQSVAVLQLVKDDEGKKSQGRVLADWTAPTKREKAVGTPEFTGGDDAYILPVSRLGIAPGQSAVLVVEARDWNDVTGPGVSRSRQAVVTVMMPKEAKEKSREALEKAAMELAQIIQKQRRNIALGRAMVADETKTPGSVKGDGVSLADSIALQEEVRADSGRLIALMDDKIPMKAVLKALYANEMVKAIAELKAVEDAGKPVPAIETALRTEREILYRLTGRSDQLKRLVETSAVRDVFAALKELIEKQTDIRDAT
ncbi:MAG: hypothetical protein ACODAJ_05385, partial [Planctomycetota bacterium]